MDVTAKHVNSVLLSLQMDIIANEDRLEKAINTTGDLEFKIMEIKDLLKKLVVSEQMLGKFQSLIMTNTKNE